MYYDIDKRWCPLYPSMGSITVLLLFYTRADTDKKWWNIYSSFHSSKFYLIILVKILLIILDAWILLDHFSVSSLLEVEENLRIVEFEIWERCSGVQENFKSHPYIYLPGAFCIWSWICWVNWVLLVDMSGGDIILITLGWWRGLFYLFIFKKNLLLRLFGRFVE